RGRAAADRASRQPPASRARRAPEPAAARRRGARLRPRQREAARMTATPARPPLLKDLNERAVLETIRAAGPISRAEISRRAGISKPTVSLALQALLDAGLVRESRSAPQGPSYGAVYFESVPEAALVLGLDLGARFLRGAICDLAGEVRARQDLELRAADVGEALTAAAGLRDSLVETSGLDGHLIDG